MWHCAVGLACHDVSKERNAVIMSVNANLVILCHIPEDLTPQNRYLFVRNVLRRSGSLRTGRSRVWTPVWARDFVVCPSIPALRPAQRLLQWVGLHGVMRPGRGIDYPLSTEVTNK